MRLALGNNWSRQGTVAAVWWRWKGRIGGSRPGAGGTAVPAAAAGWSLIVPTTTATPWLELWLGAL
jgi:hypothetical protein